jgi:hypothetical protein
MALSALERYFKQAVLARRKTDQATVDHPEQNQ